MATTAKTKTAATRTGKTAAKATREAPPPAPEKIDRPAGKLGIILDHLDKEQGATAADLMAATGWQRHSVMGALSRLRSRGFAMRVETADNRRGYILESGMG